VLVTGKGRMPGMLQRIVESIHAFLKGLLWRKEAAGDTLAEEDEGAARTIAGNLPGLLMEDAICWPEEQKKTRAGMW